MIDNLLRKEQRLKAVMHLVKSQLKDIKLIMANPEFDVKDWDEVVQGLNEAIDFLENGQDV